MPLKMRIRLEYEKYLTSRKGLARSGMDRDSMARTEKVKQYPMAVWLVTVVLGLKFAWRWTDDGI